MDIRDKFMNKKMLATMKKLDELVAEHGIVGLQKKVADRVIKSKIDNIDDDRLLYQQDRIYDANHKDIDLTHEIGMMKHKLNNINEELDSLNSNMEEEIKLIKKTYQDVINEYEINKKKYLDKYNELLEQKVELK